MAMVVGRHLLCPMPILSLLLHYATLFSSHAIEISPFLTIGSISHRTQTYGRASLAFTATPLSPTIQERIRQAASLSSQSNANATLAKEASIIWSSILPFSTDDNDSTQLTDNIQAIGFAMHASCLARIGRDVDAVSAFDCALDLRKYLTDGSILEAMTGRAYALQRLMRYKEAKNQFSDCARWSHEKNFGAETVAKASCYAATCAMRLDRLDVAKDELSWYYNLARTNCSPTIEDCEAVGMLGAVLWMDAFRKQQIEDEDCDDSQVPNEAMEKLKYASEQSNITLYRWLYYLAIKSSLKDSPLLTKSLSSKMKGAAKKDDDEDLILDLASANRSPFDDSGMIDLDDKVLLHHLLTYQNNKAPEAKTNDEENLDMDTSSFWPTSFTLPHQSADLERYISSMPMVPNKESYKCWILKDRAGYGSHGNRLVTNQEALKYAREMTDDSESLLCQKLVDPPLLIKGRKFSLRVYVVCIPNDTISADGKYDQFYISTEGLVKLASLQYDVKVDLPSSENEALLDDMHMTNSGRGDGVTMDQCDLQFLKKELGQIGYDYDELWEEIKQVVISVMKRYNNKRPKETLDSGSKTIKRKQSSNSIFCLPKILGFDFLINASCHPMLIEVNRFPGLKPRDESDAAVKHQVVMDAWYETVRVMNSPCAIVGLKEQDILRGSSLQLIGV